MTFIQKDTLQRKEGPAGLQSSKGERSCLNELVQVHAALPKDIELHSEGLPCRDDNRVSSDGRKDTSTLCRGNSTRATKKRKSLHIHSQSYYCNNSPSPHQTDLEDAEHGQDQEQRKDKESIPSVNPTAAPMAFSPSSSSVSSPLAQSSIQHSEHIGHGKDQLISIHNYANEFCASSEDILRVLHSSLQTIWRNVNQCAADFHLPGIHVFPRDECPITLYRPREDGRVAIGLTARQTYWCQYAFQFAHECCHTLIGHTHPDTRCRLESSCTANDWLEESLCEVASLFALRRMEEDWQQSPPYPHWASYAKNFSNYAEDRLRESAQLWMDESKECGCMHLHEWLRHKEEKLRQDSCNRPLNNIVAMKLLPLFERDPSCAWDSLRFFKREVLPKRSTLREHISSWLSVVRSSEEAHPSAVAFVRDLSVLLLGE